MPHTGGFAKYAAVGKPRAGRLAVDVPLTAAQATAGTITVRLAGKRGQTVKVTVNGKQAAPVDVADATQPATITLPAGALVAGENRLEVSPATVDWLQVGGAPATTAPTLHDGDALLLPEGGGLAWYVMVPSGAAVDGKIEGAGCSVEARASAHGGQTASGDLPLDLAAFAGRVIRLELTAHGCAETRLTGGALTVPGAAPTVTRGAPPKNVVFWVMDTLRVDRVRTFTPTARAETPAFDALAAKGTIFLSAGSLSPSSGPSHASLWTSTVPAVHRIVTSAKQWSKTIAPEFTTLPEALSAAGLTGVGVTANGQVGGKSYASGFARFINLMHDGSRDKLYGVLGEKLVARALSLLDEKRRHERPFFLFIGTIDTHVPWRAHEPWISRYHPDPYKGKFANAATGGGIGVGAGAMISTKVWPPRDLERIHALYDASVSYQDSLLGVLVSELAARGHADDTMIVITADHGEELWEQGRAGHGGSIRETLVHVPMLVYYPPLFPAGAVVEGVDGLDVLPTILDAIGAELPARAQGASLLPLAHGVGAGYPRPRFASQYELAWVMRLGPWKIRMTKDGAVELWDLAGDPGETTDVAAARALELRFARDVMGLYLAHMQDWPRSQWGAPSNLTARGATALDR